MEDFLGFVTLQCGVCEGESLMCDERTSRARCRRFELVAKLLEGIALEINMVLAACWGFHRRLVEDMKWWSEGPGAPRFGLLERFPVRGLGFELDARPCPQSRVGSGPPSRRLLAQRRWHAQHYGL